MLQHAPEAVPLQETVGCAQALYMLSNGALPLWAGARGQLAWRQCFSLCGFSLCGYLTAARSSLLHCFWHGLLPHCP